MNDKEKIKEAVNVLDKLIGSINGNYATFTRKELERIKKYKYSLA